MALSPPTRMGGEWGHGTKHENQLIDLFLWTQNLPCPFTAITMIVHDVYKHFKSVYRYSVNAHSGSTFPFNVQKILCVVFLKIKIKISRDFHFAKIFFFFLLISQVVPVYPRCQSELLSDCNDSSCPDKHSPRSWPSTLISLLCPLLLACEVPS